MPWIMFMWKMPKAAPAADWLPRKADIFCLMHGDAAEDQAPSQNGAKMTGADDHQNGDLIIETCRLEQGFICIHPVRKERRDKAHDIGRQILCARHQHDDACDCSGMKRLAQSRGGNCRRTGSSTTDRTRRSTWHCRLTVRRC